MRVAELLAVPRSVLLARGERTPGAAFETEARVMVVLGLNR